MNYCENCWTIDRMERQRLLAIDRRDDAMALKSRVEDWNQGKGLLRFFISVPCRGAMYEGAKLLIAAESKRIAGLEADIGKVKKSIAEAERGVFGVTPAAQNIKGLAEMLDVDLKFEDKLAETKLEDIKKRDTVPPQKCCYPKAAGQQHTPACPTNFTAISNAPCPCADIHGLLTAKLTTPEAPVLPDHRGMPCGANCPGVDCLRYLQPESIPGLTNQELLSLYRELPTPDLKAHVDAALDAAVERGVSMTVGLLAKKNAHALLKKTTKTKR